MRKLHLVIANILFVLHCLVGVVILIGWYFPEIKIFYISLLIAWIGSWIFLGYCPITKWEFLLRRKYDNTIDPNAEAIKYYMYKFFKKDISSRLIFIGGLVVFFVALVLSLTIH